jgi:hypothetical protein
MNLDIRYPIGLLFVIIGAILVACGLVLHPAAQAGPSLTSNVNLFWGLAQIVFGSVMLALAKSASGKRGGKP